MILRKKHGLTRKTEDRRRRENSMEQGELKLIGRGNTADIYEYGTDKILKLYKEGMSKEACEQEYLTTKGIHQWIEHTPKAYELISRKERCGAVYEKITGSTLLEEMIHKPWKLRSFSRQFARIHGEIMKPLSLPLPTVKEKLEEDIRHAESLSSEEKERILSYLSFLPDGRTLCHFDFHPDNIIVREGQPFIIDWMTACIGEEEADIARTFLLLGFAQIPSATPLQRIMSFFFKKIVCSVYRTEILKIRNIRPKDVEKWELPIAAARLREWIPKREKELLLELVHEKLKEPAFSGYHS